MREEEIRRGRMQTERHSKSNLYIKTKMGKLKLKLRMMRLWGT